MARPENLEAILNKMEENTKRTFQNYGNYKPYEEEFWKLWAVEKAKLLSMDWDGPEARVGLAHHAPTNMTKLHRESSFCNCCGSTTLSYVEDPVEGKISVKLGKQDPEAQLYIDGVNFYYSEE